MLTAQGQVALIWNDRVLADPLHVALEEVFAVCGGARRGALVAHEDRADVPRFFGPARPRERNGATKVTPYSPVITNGWY